MGTPWHLFMLLYFGLLAKAYVIEKGDTKLILKWTQNQDTYTIDYQENNHIEGANYTLLFTIKEVASKPNWRFGSASFMYEMKEISSSEYQFYINQYIDYESETSHSYLLTSIIGTDVISISLNTINYDDESPTLTAPMCSMKENTDYDWESTECVSTLSDPDGWLSQTTFKIINSNPKATTELEQEDKLFDFIFDKSISNTTYNTSVHLVTRRQLDYETKIFYSFVVQAKDGAGHSTIPKDDVTCIVDVIDLNDMPPQWTDYFSTKQIEEKAPYIFNVTAVDGDRGINAPIHYQLISFDEDICEDSCVSITTENGKGIIKVDPIDRDAKDLTVYKFEIMAQEEDEPPYTVNLTITFFIDDIDDNSPLFMNVTRSNDTDFNLVGQDPKIAEFTFYENFAGTIDGQIFIQDIDTGENAQFSVQLNEDKPNKYDVEYTRAFLVVPTAGYRRGEFQITVRNSTCLDFENEAYQNFSFYVHSSGTKNSSKEDDLLIKIHLLDYNDELPIFGNDSYTTEVNETIKKGQEIIQVKATDRDAEDAVLKHKLVAASAISSLMDIDSAEGIITVAVDNAFDYDRINPVIFQVQAIDKVGHTTTVAVTVNLLDINNKAPTFKVEEVIRVDENQQIGVELNATITASDVDTTRNLTAEINWDKSYAMKNSIRLNSSNPVIQKAMQFLGLTFEKISEDSISIHLIVNNNNENATAPDYETFDTLYLDVNITDLNTELPEFKEQMSIDALIVININDINDNPPIFTNESLKKNRTIYEKSKIGTIVGTIEATDADVGDVVTYSCTYVIKELDWFACDLGGEITAITANIDADTGPVYNVSIDCIATDGYWNTSQRFDIFILDTNDKTPQIMVNDTLPSRQVVKVYEKSEPDTVVTEVAYQDEDRDIPFHTAECVIDRTQECYESFRIEHNVLKVKYGGDDIDRDKKKDEYKCAVVCNDNPNLEQNDGQKSNNTDFVIRLLDINDHCPEMLTNKLEGSENIKQGDLIGKIIAEDLDAGDNAEIVMDILTVTKYVGDNTVDYKDEHLFIMYKNDSDYIHNSSSKQWYLLANKDLKNFYGEYMLQLKLNDLGTPPQSTEDPINKEFKEKAKLKLSITKYNYYPPVFVFPNASKLTFSLSSDQIPGQQLVMYYKSETFGNIEIKDGDETETCIDKWEPRFDVALTGQSASLTNFFVIKPLERCTGELQVDNSYNKHEAVDAATYQLRLTATLSNVTASKDEAKYSDYIDVKLNFIDMNEDPSFNTSLGTWNISFLEDNNTQIMELPKERKASYIHIDDTDDIPKYYFLKSSDEDVLNTFEVEMNSGTVKLKTKLDYLVKTYYEFEILAARNQSGISGNAASRMNVTVYVIEINNHVPQWTQTAFFGALLKSTQKGSTVVTINATDLDTIDQDKLTYTLNSTIQATGSDSLKNIDEAFLLDEKTGAVTLNFQVEYNMNGYFAFWVKVQDVKDDYGNGPFENRTTVTVYIVTDNNTVTFKFENSLDTVVSRQTQIIHAISTCLEWDCHDHSIDHDSQDGVQYDNVTAASIYCDQNNALLTSNDMKTKLNNIKTFQQLKNDLLEVGILLQNFNSDAATSIADLEGVLKASLIGVSVVLGALCIILIITFFLKARELKRRLKKLTEQKFGSDESNLNRRGLNAPTTNIFATEGSNPVFSTETHRDDMAKAEVSSIHSGNSDLVGLEDSPEFDDMFRAQN